MLLAERGQREQLLPVRTPRGYSATNIFMKLSPFPTNWSKETTKRALSFDHAYARSSVVCQRFQLGSRCFHLSMLC
jgi:hypothetical protein